MPALPPTSAPPAPTTPDLQLIETSGFSGYSLLDSGEGRKLEKFGDIIVDRPEPQALWRPRDPARWERDAHAVYAAHADDTEPEREGRSRWRIDKRMPSEWRVDLPSINGKSGPKVICRTQGLWHLGLFPEQAPHWSWMLERIAEVKAQGERPRVLNLFGYTGAASLLAAAAGAEVTHVDASKKSVAWARENQAASGLDAAPIRWIVDDAVKFAARDVRRKKTYHVVLLDPPKFGRGPDGEVWDLFLDLPRHLEDCASLLAPGASLGLTVYAIRASTLAFGQLVAERLPQGKIDMGELAIREAPVPGKHSRLVPTSLFTRWRANGPG